VRRSNGCGGESNLFKRRVIGRELSVKFFVKGRIGTEFFKFAYVDRPYIQD
jgi:hypothetical protein